MVVHRRGSVLLLRRELCHRPFQVILDDVRRAAELAQGLQPEPVRASARLDLPEPLEDELKVRSLDPVGADFVDTVIRNAAAQGRAVLLSSHDLTRVVAQCDRIVVILDGECRFMGTPAELQTSGQGAVAALAEMLARERADI